VSEKFASEKIKNLRCTMLEKKIDAYIITGGDAHQGEYMADYWRTRQWLSGFTGSSGTVVVTNNEAGLWTDGRYFIQAEQELKGSGITLFKMNEPQVPTYCEWLKANLPDQATISFDGRVLSLSSFKTLKKDLKSKKIFFSYDEDVVGSLWTDRPPMPASPIFAHDVCFAGQTVAQKLSAVREEMTKKQVDIYLVAALDDIAWLTNMRGSDIPKIPVFFSYLLITLNDAYLFIDEQKMTPSLHNHLEGILVCPYDAVFDYIREKSLNKTLMYCPEAISIKLFNSIPAKAESIEDDSIIGKLKAVKNEVEIKNICNASLKEGVVMVKLLRWLSNNVQNSPTETDVQNKISQLRLEQENCLGDSFTTIVAYGKNAAIVHYSPDPGDQIKQDGFLLIDTGGQYLDGTTDISRTIIMGDITDEMRRDFTLVLKSHLALACTKFLQGATGAQLDAIARVPVWAAGMDYKHGTGHGIGFCLSVHEGPYNISMRTSEHKLLAGMLCTNEPGIYKANHYGIRTENVMLVKEIEKTDFGIFLGFELLSLCPIEIKALDMTLLTQEEIDFLNSYHQMVYEKLKPFLNKEEVEWLREATKNISSK